MPCVAEHSPQLISVPPNESLEEDSPGGTFPGGILVVGGREILLFEIASLQSQEKQMGKLKRLEAKKKSTDLAEAARARGKEQERMSRMRRPKGSVEWPWSELRACVFSC
jgi:DNA damage-binding protein 1